MNSHSILNDPDYPALKQYILTTTGLDYYRNKDEEFSTRLHKRFQARGIQLCSSYLLLLTQEPPKKDSEIDALVMELTIGETYFFRHQEQFDSLIDTVIPELIKKNQGTKILRIWCAGCSFGAEPYTMSILLKEHFGSVLDGWNVEIKGTDINRDFLARAKEGLFEEWALRSLSDEKREKYFFREKTSWRIRPLYKQGVDFQYHNLLKHPFPSLIQGLSFLDLIICRNVMIYFDQETITKVIGHFEEALVTDGWLMVGHSEFNFNEWSGLQKLQTSSTFMYKKTLQEAQVSWTPPQLPPPEKETQIVSIPVFHTGLIRPLLDQGNFFQAAQICREWIAKDKLNPLIYFFNALVLDQMGPIHADEAEKCLRQAIYLDRHFVLAHFVLGTIKKREKWEKEAHLSFNNALKILEIMPEDRTFPEWDGISVKEMKNLVRIHLEV